VRGAPSIPGRRRPAPGRLAAALAAALLALAALGAWPGGELAIAPLEVLTARLTAAMLAPAGLAVVRQGTVLLHPGGFACDVAASCTALVPATLLVAAILSQPLGWPSRLAGAAAGAAVVAGVNQARLVGLVWLGVRAPGWFEPAHAFMGPALLALATAGCGLAWFAAAQR
jgi:exosortase/archaeosortase family protein